jgi:hypothetical protein
MSDRKSRPLDLRLHGEMTVVLMELDVIKDQIADLTKKAEAPPQVIHITETQPVADPAPPVDLSPIRQDLFELSRTVSVLRDRCAQLERIASQPKPQPGPVRIRVTRRDINDNIIEVESY